ncbi:MAG: CARDB domain-containing protein [Candidatus Pacearchaeota archaeon]
MIIKIILTILMVFLAIFASIIIYENVPHDPINLNLNFGDVSLGEDSKKINYNQVSVFAEYMRFDHNNISYNIKGSCPKLRLAYIEEAFGILNENVRQLSFYQVDEDADISIECSEDYVEIGKNLFAAGEGGPTKIIKNGKFNIIEKGTIYLYQDPICDYPIVELHELLHVFGFNHSNDKKNIMFAVSDCEQRLSENIISALQNLYEIPVSPDLIITNLSAVKRGRYLDFNITIANEGLSGAEEVTLLVSSNGKEIQTFNLGEIEMGYGRTLYSVNVKMFSSDIKTIDFYVDGEDKISELDESNNKARLNE